VRVVRVETTGAHPPCMTAAVATPPTEPPLDAAHARARDAVAHYAPAEPRALGAMAIVAILAILWVLLPLGIGVLVGALLAFTLYRPYKPLVRRTRRPVLVALVLTTGATLLVAGTVGVLGYVLVLQGVAILSRVPEALSPGGGASLLVARLARPFAFFISPDELVGRLKGALGGIATSLAGIAAQTLGIVFDGVLAIFFMAITMFYVLLSWSDLARRAERLMPINPHHTRRLMREVRRLGRIVVVGNFGTALVQGLVAWVGYMFAHVPEPAFFGAITAVASLVPVFGTMLVWVPAGVFLLLSGHTGAGIFELVWGSVAVVGLCDYFVRPRLIGRGETLSMWMTFVGLFGGIQLFGFIGFLLGPLLVGTAVAVLRLYERTRRFRLGLS
jgi:predicted PurR-regulated permease PerM